MPCTNVRIRIAIGEKVDAGLLDMAKSTAHYHRERLDVWQLEDGRIAGLSERDILRAKDWMLAIAAMAAARRQGLKGSVRVRQGEIVVEGVGL